jgi:hypothetical protein
MYECAVGFERGSPERTGKFVGTCPFKAGREAPFATEALENRVHEARSWQEPGLCASINAPSFWLASELLTI